MISAWTTALIALLLLIKYYWSRRRLYSFANSLPGPPALPFVGNALSFLDESKGFLKAVEEISGDYPKPFRVWLGPDLVIYFKDPEHIEKILSSKSITHKHDIYEFFKIYVGEGLISGSGEKWKRNRKIIQPLVNSRFVYLCTNSFGENIATCMETLEGRADKGDFDVHQVLHMCCVDIIGESFLGIHMNAQRGKNLEYIEAMCGIYDIVNKKIIKPWFQSDLLFALFGNIKQQNRIIKKNEEFFRMIIAESRKRIELRGIDKTDEDRPIVDQVIESFYRNSIEIDEQELIHHMLTLYLASEDTIMETCSFLCLLLGMYPQYQAIAAKEIRSIFGDKPRPVVHEDLSKLQYTEMCIKDVIRLFPIAPYILRKTTEDFEIDDMIIPEGCAVLVSIYEAHRDPNHWEHPNEFYPDHFLAEAVSKRHPYSFVPFSAGPRGCIGKHFAMTVLKMLAANILQRFRIEADGKIGDIKLKSDISVRAVSGYNVRLKRRIWT